MNCLNGEKYLREAIDSIYAQTYEDWEIIFWEDVDSTDSSGDIAKSYGSKLRHFKANTKLPLYGARNQAIQKARGRYIAILDQDDIWMPAKLDEQVHLLENDSRVGMVYSDCIIFNEKGKEKQLFNIVKPARGMVFSKLLLNNFINTQTVIIRREALESLNGLFDGRLIMSGDYDAYLRISHNWKLDYIDKPLAKYRVHGKSTTINEGRRLLEHEIGLTIDTLVKTIPEFTNKHSEGYRFLERRQNVLMALLDWERGNKHKARRTVRPYIFNNIYYFGLYPLMFFPYSFVFKPFYRFYNKNPLSDLI